MQTLEKLRILYSCYSAKNAQENPSQAQKVGSRSTSTPDRGSRSLLCDCRLDHFLCYGRSHHAAVTVGAAFPEEAWALRLLVLIRIIIDHDTYWEYDTEPHDPSASQYWSAWVALRGIDLDRGAHPRSGHRNSRGWGLSRLPCLAVTLACLGTP